MNSQRPLERPMVQTKQQAASASAHPQATSIPPHNRPTERTHSGVPKKWLIILGVLLLVAIIAHIALHWFRIIGPMAGVKADKYQAVFLANDQAQVYFGKITSITEDTIVLKDVYYIKSQAKQNDEKNEESSQQPQAVLTKIDNGNELHSPYNEMFINRDQVLFWENIKDDSKIVKTIKGDSSQ